MRNWQVKGQQERCFQTYGYRRMCLWLRSQQIHRNPRIVLRIMKKYGLLFEVRRYKKWRQMGLLHKYEIPLNREIHAGKPNFKWVTDIFHIHTKQCILYLSIIRELFDNSIIAYKTGPQQTVNLVLDYDNKSVYLNFTIAFLQQVTNFQQQQFSFSWFFNF